jgi:hypothetical protein
MYIRIIFILQIDFEEKTDTGVIYLKGRSTSDGENEWIRR